MVIVMARTEKKLSRHLSAVSKRVRLAVSPTNPRQHARKIAESVNRAWYQAHGYGNLEIPVSVVAALSFLAPPEHRCDEVAMHLLTLDPPAFATLARAVGDLRQPPPRPGQTRMVTDRGLEPRPRA
jgi:hypothetical protein